MRSSVKTVRSGATASKAVVFTEDGEPVAMLAAVIADPDRHVANQLLLEANVVLLAVGTTGPTVDGWEQPARESREEAQLSRIGQQVPVGIAP